MAAEMEKAISDYQKAIGVEPNNDYFKWSLGRIRSIAARLKR